MNQPFCIDDCGLPYDFFDNTYPDSKKYKVYKLIRIYEIKNRLALLDVDEENSSEEIANEILKIASDGETNSCSKTDSNICLMMQAIEIFHG